jgi:hypothetical protein
MFSRLVRRHDVHLLVRGPRARSPQPGLTVHTFSNVLAVPERIPAPLRRLWLLPAFWWTAARAARRLARQIRPVVVIGFSHYGAWPAWRAGQAAGVPSVLKLFGVMHAVRLEWPLPRYLYHSLEGVLAFKVPLDHFVILNDGTRGEAAARRWGVSPDRITWLPNASTRSGQKSISIARRRAVRSAPRRRRSSCCPVASWPRSASIESSTWHGGALEPRSGRAL